MATKKRYFQDLTEEERQTLIERWRRELPELTRRTERALDNLGRIAAGRRPQRR